MTRENRQEVIEFVSLDTSRNRMTPEKQEGPGIIIIAYLLVFGGGFTKQIHNFVVGKVLEVFSDWEAFNFEILGCTYWAIVDCCGRSEPVRLTRLIDQIK